jgi:hypothetical protein
MQNLVRLSRVAPNTLPLSKATFYKMHHLKKNPQIFVKIGGALFLDIDALEQLIEKGRGN